MLGGDREARQRGDRAYYSLPETGWDEVDPELAADLCRLHRLLSLARAQLPAEPTAAEPASGGVADAEAPPTPAQLAFRFYEVANRLWAQAASEEQDLRQVITTLRTALAVCWDLYGVREAERTTVAQFMKQLRERIEDFERDLGVIQAEHRREVEPGQ